VVEAAGESVWKLLDALSEQVTSTTGAAVDRLDAHAVGPKRSRRRNVSGGRAREAMV